MNGYRPEPSETPGVIPLGGKDASGDDLTLLALFNVVLRRRRPIVLLALVVAAIVGTVTILKPRVYSSQARFVPQNARPMSSLAGLAAQFGVDFGQSSSGSSPAFYVDLTRSKGVLAKLLDTTFTIETPDGPRTGTVADHLGVEAPNESTRRSFTIGELQLRVRSGYDLATSIVTVTAITENPELSRVIADMILVAANRFNLENRQSQARAERRFAEARLAEMRQELRDAENALQSFLARNRALGSPELSTERERLQREVSLRTAVYTTMSQSFEQAKLEEVRDIPVITVIEHPERAIFPDPRRLVGKTVLAFLSALLLGIVLALIHDRFTRSRSMHSDTLREFRELRHEALLDVRSPLRVLRARAGGSPPLKS